MANVILSPALIFVDLRRKFGTCVKPPAVAASAPRRTIFLSLKMSPSERAAVESIRLQYTLTRCRRDGGCGKPSGRFLVGSPLRRCSHAAPLPQGGATACAANHRSSDLFRGHAPSGL